MMFNIMDLFIISAGVVAFGVMGLLALTSLYNLLFSFGQAMQNFGHWMEDTASAAFCGFINYNRPGLLLIDSGIYKGVAVFRLAMKTLASVESFIARGGPGTWSVVNSGSAKASSQSRQTM